ncbi:alpha/beta hydrolase [Prodigiosinella confusarubida]|uniref:Alpha/beta hydrolase n=1 Tax=Serratia sp. (strain ATCC 39006) TaxID=104623 RepID=A0A2I5T399_SERS3|nr:alpha/beta hydrolase [Serratia sp. ATCC 39006]AUG99042.1 alpha/beta hydrolase [Serratia sp. ATCC 39006]AUH03357.1 alpha/beta hydrolase [Serratia sp. ATCC 39006]
MQQVNISGAQVSFHVSGKGPGLVLVHGTGADHETNWGHLIERFTDIRTVVCPDYAGSGKTQDDTAQLTIEYIAAQVVAAAQAAQVDSFDIVGFSLGASVAAYIAAEYPERVRSAILLAGFSSSKDSRIKLEFELWRDLIKTDRAALAKIILLTGFSPEFISSMSDEEIQENINLIVSENQWEGMARQVELDLNVDIISNVGKIIKPTLVIGCTHDHLVPVQHAVALAELIPSATYTEIPSGHLAVHECPDLLVNIIRDFIQK